MIEDWLKSRMGEQHPSKKDKSNAYLRGMRDGLKALKEGRINKDIKMFNPYKRTEILYTSWYRGWKAVFND